MTVVLLDATEMRRDWLQKGLSAQLLGYASRAGHIEVAVPAVVIEELVAHHGRQSADFIEKLRRLSRDAARLGFDAIPEAVSFDFRSTLISRLEEWLWATVLPWPDVAHASLVDRAVNRVPPFDSSGSGYRDSLVWASAVELAKKGKDVVLVSADKSFSHNGALRQELAQEVSTVPGSLVVIDTLAPWLLDAIPWKAQSVPEAIATARDEDFFPELYDSDLHEWLTPPPESMGFGHAPYSFEVDEVEWTGGWDRLGSKSDEVHWAVVEYEIYETVSFQAVLPAAAPLEEHMEIEESFAGRQRVRGALEMVVSIRVLFDDEGGWLIEETGWRRADGVAAGPGVVPPESGSTLF